MPELPEVEQFRQLLLPLVSVDDEHGLQIEAVGINPRIQMTDEQIEQVGGSNYFCTDVLRKGKQLCLVLDSKTKKNDTKYLYLHMGMTGRIRIEGRAENWGGKKLNGVVAETDLKAAASDESFPPKYTYLIFTSNNYTAYFCDPRKFGSCFLADEVSAMDSLAPDALTCKDPEVIESHILPKLTNQRLGIKAVLLDQKRAVSGVGNWVADEVLYQCQMHPDQRQLNDEQAVVVWETLQSIVSVAVDALRNDTHYPEAWLFAYRWSKKKTTKDAEGRTITFLTSGGRTSAIAASMQKLISKKPAAKAKTSISKKQGIKAESTTSEAPTNGRKRILDEAAASPRKRTVVQPATKEDEDDTVNTVPRRSPRSHSSC